jgi:hypothetical protein
VKLTRPKNITWWIAVILGILALLGALAVSSLAPFAIWFALIGLALLAIACLVKGL